MKAVSNMNNKKHPFIFIFNVLIFFVLTLLHYTDKTAINISGISPVLILPLLTAFSMFHSPIASALTGLFVGIFMDSCTIGSYCFNAIILLCLGTAMSLAANNLFNKNVLASVVISLITCFLYHIAQWLVFQTFGKAFNESLIYLLQYAAPSALLSSLFVIPFYFLYRYFNKITSN